MYSGVSKLVRHGGFRVYHSLLSLNYRFELFARGMSTPAGTYRTYELADTHSADTLLALIEATAETTACIYDIGAYVGAYSLALAADYPDRTVVAFEPSREHCSRFRKNLEQTAPEGTVTVRNVGISDRDETREFYHSTFPKLSSFEYADATRWGGRVTHTERVPIRTLDSLAAEIPPPDHVKIDVEGHTPAVLRGAVETVETHSPVLYIEPHDRPGVDRTGAITDWCDDHEYTVSEYGDVLVCIPPETDAGDILSGRLR